MLLSLNKFISFAGKDLHKFYELKLQNIGVILKEWLFEFIK